MSSNSQDATELLSSLDSALPCGDLGTLLSYPPELRFIAERGEGGKLYDTQGNEYIDFLMASGPLILGHRHPTVLAAAREQIERGASFYQPTASIVKLATMIVDAAPGRDKLRFVTTGAEATYYALRLARAFTGREKVLRFAGAYHGSHDYSLVGFMELDYDPLKPSANSAGIPAAVAETVVVSDFNDLDMVRELMTTHGEEIAAIITEPILGVVPPEPGFLGGLRELANKHGSVLIFDEMITGFRLAYGGAQEAFGVTPDISTYGKIVGGGYPLAAICGREDIMALSGFDRRAESDYVLFSGTLYANPVAAAAGAAALGELKKPGTYESLDKISEDIRVQLRELVNELGIAAQVVGVGPVFNIFFTSERVINHRQIMGARMDLGRELLLRLARERVLVSSSKGWLSTAHTDEEVAAAVAAYRRCLESMIEEGLF